MMVEMMISGVKLMIVNIVNITLRCYITVI